MLLNIYLVPQVAYHPRMNGEVWLLCFHGNRKTQARLKLYKS